MKIQDKLFKFLFPKKAKTLNDLKKVTPRKKKEREENYADLMRDNLGSLKINVLSDSDFLDGLPENERNSKLALINDVFRNEAFSELCDYLINQQGNFTLMRAVSDAQIFAGRFNINGIQLLKREVERCHLLYEENNKIEDDFDPNEVFSN